MKEITLKKSMRFAIVLLLAVTIAVPFWVFGSVTAEAKTITITTPEQLRNLNWKSKGFGPGNYKIGNDMTLNDPELESTDGHAVCPLTKGNFTIDFNGHTVQNATANLTVFQVAGANVVLKDSKASKNKPSVRSYGAGAVQITGGKLTINSGVYYGASTGQNNPAGLHVGGGICVVNGGYFLGDHVGASCAGGKLYINGGSFETTYMFALMQFGGGNIKISKGKFTNSKVASFNPTFALGAFNPSGTNYDFSSWLASGSSFSPTITSYYWSGSSNDTSPYPTTMKGTQYVQTPYTYNYAVAYTGNSGYEAVTIKVSSKAATPAATKITSVKAGKKSLTIKWKKVKKNSSGYIVQCSTSKKFKKNVKTVNINKATKTKTTVKKLKSGKKYYVRVRTFRSFNGTKFKSKWSKVKSKKVK